MKLTSGMVDNENVLLCEKLSLYPEKTKFKVSVTSTRVVIDRLDGDKSEEVILLDDVIGCHILQDKKRNVTTAYVCIFSYPLKKKRLGSGVIRQRNAKTLTVDVKKSYQENLLLAETWKMTIKRLITGEKITTKEDIENGSLAARNLLVLINPFSGRKKAASIYKEKVRPMFTEAEIRHTVRKTEYPGHAKEMAKQINIDDWDGIVIISGDGLVHEVMNGLMDRPDWKTAISMPIGIVPGGSGNALAAAIVYASTGQILSGNLELDSVFEVTKGKTRKMSIVAIETQPGRRFYSFLNFAWGFIADVDIESERFRKLGPVRFTIGCAIRVANMRLYQGRISYLPAIRNAYSFGRSCQDTSYTLSDNGEDSFPERKGYVFRRVFSRRSKTSSDQDALHPEIDLVSASMPSGSNQSEVLENGMDVEGESTGQTTISGIMADNEGPVEATFDVPNTITGAENGYDVDEDAEYAQVADDEIDGGPAAEQNSVEACDQTCSQNSTETETVLDTTPIAWQESAILYHLRSDIDSRPPDDWVQIESEYIWVTSVYLSHLGNEMMGVPSARLDDDVMYIYTLRRGISKTQMVNVLMGFEGGTHIERGGEFSNVIPCRAVRLEPFTVITGHMTVDGELIHHSSLQASVTPHKINLMSSVSE